MFYKDEEFKEIANWLDQAQQNKTELQRQLNVANQTIERMKNEDARKDRAIEDKQSRIGFLEKSVSELKKEIPYEKVLEPVLEYVTRVQNAVNGESDSEKVKDTVNFFFEKMCDRLESAGIEIKYHKQGDVLSRQDKRIPCEGKQVEVADPKQDGVVVSCSKAGAVVKGNPVFLERLEYKIFSEELLKKEREKALADRQMEIEIQEQPQEEPVAREDVPVEQPQEEVQSEVQGEAVATERQNAVEQTEEDEERRYSALPVGTIVPSPFELYCETDGIVFRLEKQVVVETGEDFKIGCLYPFNLSKRKAFVKLADGQCILLSEEAGFVEVVLYDEVANYRLMVSPSLCPEGIVIEKTV